MCVLGGGRGLLIRLCSTSKYKTVLISHSHLNTTSRWSWCLCWPRNRFNVAAGFIILAIIIIVIICNFYIAPSPVKYLLQGVLQYYYPWIRPITKQDTPKQRITHALAITFHQALISVWTSSYMTAKPFLNLELGTFRLWVERSTKLFHHGSTTHFLTSMDYIGGNMIRLDWL